MKSFSFLPILGIALVSTLSAAIPTGEYAQKNAMLDLDDNGQLDQTDVLLGLKYLQEPDKTNPFQIKADYKRTKKLPAWLEKPDEKLTERFAIFLMTAGGLPPYPLDKINPKEFGIKSDLKPGPDPVVLAQQKYKSQWDIKLRRTTDDLTKPVKDAYAQGAIFSYGHDLRADEYQLTARGVLGISYSLIENEKYDPEYEKRRALLEANPSAIGPPLEQNVNFLRSAEGLFTFEFDRLKATKPTVTGTDSMKFGLHLVTDIVPGYRHAIETRQTLDELAKQGKPLDPSTLTYPFFKSLLVDAAVNWATDSDFERDIKSVQLDLSPQFDIPGMGSFQSALSYGENFHALAFRWSIAAHLEAGTVADAGNTKDKFATDEFARVGGRALVEFLIAPEALENRLSVTASYLQYPAFHGDSPDNGLFRATGQFVLPIGSGRYFPSPSGALGERDILATLKIEYQNGTLPITLEEDESILFGLGILF